MKSFIYRQAINERNIPAIMIKMAIWEKHIEEKKRIIKHKESISMINPMFRVELVKLRIELQELNLKSKKDEALIAEFRK